MSGFLILSFFVTPVQTALADSSLFPKEINYQAKLSDASNIALPDGAYNVAFRLYTTAVSATTTNIWEELHNTGGTRIQVSNGLLSVMLGQVTSLANVNFNQTLYLGVEIGGTGAPTWDGEMTPRKQLGAVPAAMVADTLDGVDSQQFVRTDATSTIAASSAQTLLTLNQTGAGNVLTLTTGATTIFTATNGGNIGVGTSSPFAKLSVAGNGVFDATVTASTLIATSTTATSTLRNLSTTQFAIGTLSGILKATSGYVATNATSDDLSEGITNLYYSPLRGAALIAGTTTDALLEGATNKYFSSPLARLAVAGLFPATTTVNTWNSLQTYTGGVFSSASSTAQFLTIGFSTTTAATSTDLYSLRSFLASLSFTNATGTSIYASGSSTLQNFNSASSTFGLVLVSSATATNLFSTNINTTNLSFTNSTGTSATTSNLYANNLRLGNSTTTANNGISLSGGCFAIGGNCLTFTDTGITSLNGASALSQTFATGSDTNITLTVNTTGNNLHTFNPGWQGTLAATRGGTGLSSITQNQLLIGGAANTVT